MQGFNETLKVLKVSNGWKSFYFYLKGEPIVDYVSMVESAFFLESLFRGCVPFIGQLVSQPDDSAMPYYPGVWKPPFDRWDKPGNDKMECLIMNEACFKLLVDHVVDFDWFANLDYTELHKTKNLYLFQFTQCEGRNTQYVIQPEETDNAGADRSTHVAGDANRDRSLHQ